MMFDGRLAIVPPSVRGLASELELADETSARQCVARQSLVPSLEVPLGDCEPVRRRPWNEVLLESRDPIVERLLAHRKPPFSEEAGGAARMSPASARRRLAG
jgi:hypothetical protein